MIESETKFIEVLPCLTWLQYINGAATFGEYRMPKCPHCDRRLNFTSILDLIINDKGQCERCFKQCFNFMYQTPSYQTAIMFVPGIVGITLSMFTDLSIVTIVMIGVAVYYMCAIIAVFFFKLRKSIDNNDGE